MTPAAALQEAPEDGRRQVEGDVADDDVDVEGVTCGIGHLDTHRRERAPQPRGPVLVDVDRREGPAESRQDSREGSVAGPELEDRAGRLTDECGYAAERRPVGEEVLAEFVTAAVQGSRHECAPEEDSEHLGERAARTHRTRVPRCDDISRAAR